MWLMVITDIYVSCLEGVINIGFKLIGKNHL